ncbi:hypothetical protein D3C87_2072010 [compost metagenome]
MRRVVLRAIFSSAPNAVQMAGPSLNASSWSLASSRNGGSRRRSEELPRSVCFLTSENVTVPRFKPTLNVTSCSADATVRF